MYLSWCSVFKLYSDSALSSRDEDSDPPGLLNSIDASFQMRLKELEEKQEVWNKHQKILKLTVSKQYHVNFCINFA